MSCSQMNPKTPFIPLKDILLATDNFGPEARVGDDASLYIGQLSERWENRMALFKRFDEESRNKVEIMSNFNHENILSLFGYCDEANEMIAVFEGNSLGSGLYDELDSCDLQWGQRLKICLGIARGLEYLHSGLGDHSRVIRGDMSSVDVILDDKMEAKITDLGLSSFVDVSEDSSDEDAADEILTVARFYLDPIYKESGVLNTEADVYSFGIILFEILTGTVAATETYIDGHPHRLINLVRRFSHGNRMDKLLANPPLKDKINARVLALEESIALQCISWNLKDKINAPSVLALKEIALQCISWNLKDRPNMKTIINRIQEAMNNEKQEDDSEDDSEEDTRRRYLPQILESLLIPLEEIISATENFSSETCIGSGALATVYKGRWHNRIVAIKRLNPDSHGKDEFIDEVLKMSRFHHQNVVALVGFCEDVNEKVMVCDYAYNGSLDRHLQDPDKRCFITWAQRLKICLEVARGLEYLHSGIGEDVAVIHRGIKSENILLDHNWEAKIAGFGLSLLVSPFKPQVYHFLSGTSNYMDPIYSESGIVNTELDVYAFGVVMLEVLSGMLAYKPTRNRDDNPQTLTHMIRRYYNDDGADILVDPLIRDQINIHSFHVFAKTAYRCISYNLEDRPTMRRVIRRIEEALEIQKRTNKAEGAASTVFTRRPRHQDLQKLRIPLNDINYTPDKEHRVGDGGFGNVYKGRLSEGLWKGIVAVKCLDPKGFQGKKEFLTEVQLMSSFHHPNIIPFVGYCDEGDQMIMVTEYAVNGSLDQHLDDPVKRERLTWAQRLKICLGVAKGLDYLHSGQGMRRVIHRDVKSGNILLDKYMEAKLCDFGLSKQDPTISQQTQIYTKAAGTMFYLDPVYLESGILSKESDVYSFGVVLFEMLSGSLVYRPITFVDGSPQNLIKLVRRFYKKESKKLIDLNIRDEVGNQCFHTFKELAYQCINLKSAERPTMDTIIDRLEDAIEFQEHEV